ncbi:MAG TPA: hypothetical protein VE863_12940 [Pyrinomonadaceae bacterium]|jgi:hypothetical protein|nr:hypothetical protein [Pyrinomonadaceae bacterium]
MRFHNSLGKVLMLALALVLMSGTLSFARTFDYKFKIHNNTKQKIVAVKVREEGKDEWGDFDVGDGIAAGATDEMVWDKSTDNSGCNWFFKAKFADGEWSDAVKFDFCEKNLVIEFN